MNANFEYIEQALHTVIDKATEIAKGVAKATVTLVCLGGSVAYEAGVKLRAFVDNTQTNQEQEPQTTDDINSVEEEIVQDSEETQEPEMIAHLWDIEVAVEEIEAVIEEITEEPVLLLEPAKEVEEEVIPEFNGKPAYYHKTGAGRCRKGYRKLGDRCVQIKYLRQQELEAVAQ